MDFKKIIQTLKDKISGVGAWAKSLKKNKEYTGRRAASQEEKHTETKGFWSNIGIVIASGVRLIGAGVIFIGLYISRAFSKCKEFVLSVVKGERKLRPLHIGAAAAALCVCIAIPIAIAVNSDKGPETIPASVISANDSQGSGTTSSNDKTGSTNVSNTPEGGTQSSTGSTASSGTPAPTPQAPKKVELKYGVDDESVADLQERLMELGYMDEDEPTTHYGNMTRTAVQLFQRKHNLTVDGCAGEETLKLLKSDSATKYSVSAGVNGEDVRELQKRLIELDYLSGSATGYYGSDTEEAVKAFQKKNDLTADGTIGEKTREKLYSDDVVANSYGYGTTGDDVKKLQQRLVKLGYMTSEDADGIYGKGTLAAVRRFQERNSLIADGCVGVETKALLFSDKAQSNALMMGMSGDDVTKVQERLKELKYMTKATGYYGSGTESAVKSFQKRNGLTVDGKVGRKTMNVLFSSSAKKASSSSSSSSSGSSGSSGSSSSSSGSSGSSSGSSANIGSANSSKVEQLIAVAESKLGCKYVRGGKGPNKFDCSGFVYWCINQVGVNQSYMTSGTWAKCTKYPKITDMKKLERGDIVSFKGHVTIYLGNGYMIDASSSNGKVRKTTTKIWDSSYWKRNFICGFRVL